MGARENKVEKYLDSEIKKLGGTTRKWVCPTYNGAPDRIVIIQSHVIFVEVKTVDGKLSVAQTREHQRLYDHGAIVRTVYGVDDVDNFIEELKRCLVVS